MNSLPFTLPDLYGGFAEMEGVASVSAAGVCLEFQVKDSVFGVVKSMPQELLVPFAELAEVGFKKGVFNGRLTLRSVRLATFASIPGSAEAKLVLKCKREYRELAAEMASHIALRITEHEVRKMSDSIAGQLEPQRSPTPPVIGPEHRRPDRSKEAD